MNTLRNKLIACLLPAIGALCLCGGCAQTIDTPYVVVISMDGFRYDYPDNARTPTLDSIARHGVRAALRPAYPSATFPNHYTLATGLYPDHHGIINNNFFAQDLQLVYRFYDPKAVRNPDFYGGEPIWNTAERQGVRAATFFWVGSEAPIQGRQPSIWKAYDKSIPFLARADSVLAWLSLPNSVRPHLILWYMEEPDAIGHAASPDSPDLFAKVEQLDSVLRYFFDNARKLKHVSRINFIILSDHGMAPTDPNKCINLNDYLPRDSFLYIFDGIPTLLYPKPSYADTAYRILQTIPHIRAYRKSNIPQQFHYGAHPRISELVVAPDIGAYVRFSPRHAPPPKGAHGYDNFEPQMQAGFYATGPAFRNNLSLPPFDNVNIYLLIAQLLHLQPAPNDANPAALAPFLN